MLIDIATSLPPYKVSQERAKVELKKRMATRPAIERLIDAASLHSGISTRYVVVPDGEENNSSNFYSLGNNTAPPDTKLRMNEYEKWARQLTKEAVQKLINQTNLDTKNVDRLITISCTGFYAPGVDYDLINEFEIPCSVKRTHIGFMGCAASLIGFNSVYEAISSNKNSNTILVSVELCSLHLHTEPTRDNILANMIFGDGAAAVLFSNENNSLFKPRLELLQTHSVLFNNSKEIMGWKIGNNGFEMILSSELPKIILEYAAPSILNILKGYGYTRDSINHWALHPGGRAVLDALQNGLGLEDKKLLPSRNTLKNFGNMSSATILFVLKEIFDTSKVNKGELCCAVAFGPGLTMEVVIMKAI